MSVIALLVPCGSKPVLRPKSVDLGLSWACFEVIVLSLQYYISFCLKNIAFFSGLRVRYLLKFSLDWGVLGERYSDRISHTVGYSGRYCPSYEHS